MSEKTCENCKFGNNVYLACFGCKPTMSGHQPKPLTEVECARREGKAEGLREAAKILLSAAQADERYASNTAAAHLRERHALLAENERVLETRLLARAEEVEKCGG